MRAGIVEKIVAKICREAGARVRENVRIADMNVDTNAGDNRRIEVVASGLTCRSGRQLAVDVAVRSVLAADGVCAGRRRIAPMGSSHGMLGKIKSGRTQNSLEETVVS